MLTQDARLATQTGLGAERVLLIEDGDVIELSADAARRIDRVSAGRIFVDRGASGEIDDLVVRDRRHISAEGILVPIVVLDRTTGALQSPPEIVMRGLPDATILDAEIALRIEEILAGRPPEERLDPALTRERLRLEIRRLVRRRTDKKPLVIPVVLEV
jgi:ribonuclease J